MPSDGFAVLSVSVLTGALLVALTILVHYEVLWRTYHALPRLTIPPRPRVLVAIGAALLAHIVEIWLYAVAYQVLEEASYGALRGQGGEALDPSLVDYVYYSTVAYTTLGLGDLVPVGGLRIISGIESLNGFILITWTASFTYLAMERFWGQHMPRHPRHGEGAAATPPREPSL